MRSLIVSDVHANLPALQAVLASAPEYDVVWNLGDIVGYGADPNEVADTVRRLGGIVVRGNHDSACSGIMRFYEFRNLSLLASTAAVWTQSMLTKENKDWLAKLPRGPISAIPRKVRCVHGAPHNEDLLLCSMGFNPGHTAYTVEAKTWTLARLLPLVEANFSIMELAPKGTGKSFVFENISNKVAVISGGKVTAARLFIDGRTKEIGLLGRHDVVVLDEVQSLTFDNPDEIIGPLKTYLANGRYNRSGFQEIASDCSLVMLANIELDERQRPRNQQNILADLPAFLNETAFLDRFAGILPGWLIPKFHKDMVATQPGLKMDFFGEALFSLRRVLTWRQS